MTRAHFAELLDGEIAQVLAAGPVFEPLSSLEELPSWRAGMAQRADGYVRTGAVEGSDHVVTSHDGYQFNVRVHRGVGDARQRPAVVWMHGGGFVGGTYRTDDERFDRWCSDLGVVGISVDYGLAPERAYPGPLEDCYAALTWAHHNAGELGIANNRIGVGGLSAGGGLAAALALLARDRAGLAVAFQLLQYPMLDDRMTNLSSSWDAPIWPPVSNDVAWNAYLEGRRGQADVPIYAAPARAADLSGLPPTVIGVGTLDCFFDEDLEYAYRLAHAGVAVDVHVYAGAPHGFDSLTPSAGISRRCRHDLDGWLARQTGRNV